MDRNKFFGDKPKFEELLDQSRSSDPTERWIAAIGLSQHITLESARILWNLSRDDDPVTRDAATVGLREFDSGVLKLLEQETSGKSDTEFVPRIWKYQNIGPLTKESEGSFLETIENILWVEGPTTGSRIQRLLGMASGQNRSMSQPKVSRLLERLLFTHTIARVDIHFDSEDISNWIVKLPTQPDFAIRDRNDRLLTEIPVNEARAVLSADRQFQRRPDNREVAFAILTEQYVIAPNEFFLVGEALEHQWRGLFG